MKHSIQTELYGYIEIPRTNTAPTRIDAILEERMRTFMKARRIRRFTFSK